MKEGGKERGMEGRVEERKEGGKEERKELKRKILFFVSRIMRTVQTKLRFVYYVTYR